MPDSNGPVSNSKLSLKNSHLTTSGSKPSPTQANYWPAHEKSRPQPKGPLDRNCLTHCALRNGSKSSTKVPHSLCLHQAGLHLWSLLALFKSPRVTTIIVFAAGLSPEKLHVCNHRREVSTQQRPFWGCRIGKVLRQCSGNQIGKHPEIAVRFGKGKLGHFRQKMVHLPKSCL